MKKQLNLSGAFSCLSRCLIYKVHTALLRRLSRIPHRFSFVKNFFRTFSSRFAILSFAGFTFAALSPARFTFAAPAALSDSLLRIPHSLPLVKNFFRNFSSPFVLSARKLICFPCLCRSAEAASRKALDYITRVLSVCQHLFPFFSRFFATMKIVLRFLAPAAP